MSETLESKNREVGKYTLGVVLLLGLLQGLLYIFIVPPWQHYDEPGNFEYAWLLANLDHWPQTGEYDVEMHREIAASMIETNFYHGKTSLPNLVTINPPADIGYSQLSDVPLYFLLVSIPLRIIRYTDITFQLYVARFVSLLLLLLMLWASLGICRDLFGKNHILSWIIPSFLGFLPPFIDLMTAVNNDVAAIAFSTLFLWGCTRIILHGFTFRRGLWVIVALVACNLSKSTTIITLPLLMLVISFGLYKFIRRRILIPFMALIGIIIAILMFSWTSSSPMFFYARNEYILPTRLLSEKPPVGEHIFALPAQKGIGKVYFQMLPQSKIPQLVGKTITLGVWMWADQPVDIRLPDLIVDNKSASEENYVHLGIEPRFYASSTQFPNIADNGWITVYAANSSEEIMVYWDGWVLTEGDYSASTPPIFQDEQASAGSWNGSHFVNIVRNASGELFWPKFISPVSKYLSANFNFTSSYLWSIFDIKGIGWYYQLVLNRIYQTFWYKFGWAHVSLVGPSFYWIFSLLSFSGFVGSLLAIWYYRKRMPLSLILFFGLDLLGTFWITILRGVGTWFSRLLLPAARYAYPAIIPISIILCAGWFFLFDRYIHRIWIPRSVFLVCFMVGMITYDILSLLSIVIYYGI